MGFGLDPEARRQRLHNEAEKRALAAANKVATVLGFTGGGPGVTGPKSRSSSTPQPKNPIRLEMPELELPGSDLRVEYGQNVGNIAVTTINEFDRDLKVQLKMWMFTVDGNVTMEFLPSVNFDLPKDFEERTFWSFRYYIDKGTVSYTRTLQDPISPSLSKMLFSKVPKGHYLR